MPNLNELTAELEKALPADMHGNIDLLVQLIRTYQSGARPIEIDHSAQSTAVDSMLYSLQGQQIRTSDAVVSFGNNGNFGDVTIRDVAGGNISTITINIHAGKEQEFIKKSSEILLQIRKFEEVIDIFNFLTTELFTISTRTGLFTAEIQAIIETATPQTRDLALKRMKGTMALFAEALRDYSLGQRTARHEYQEWLDSTERSLQYIFLLPHTQMDITRKSIQDFIASLNPVCQQSDTMRQAVGRMIDQLQRLLMPQPVFATSNTAVLECIQELHQFVATLGRGGDFFARLRSTLTLMLRVR